MLLGTDCLVPLTSIWQSFMAIAYAKIPTKQDISALIGKMCHNSWWPAISTQNLTEPRTGVLQKDWCLAIYTSAESVCQVDISCRAFWQSPSCRVSYVATYAIATFAGKNIWLASAISLWAVLTAFSRALMGRHYLGDVTIGVALGFLTTAIGSKVGPFAPVQAHKQAM